MRRHLLLGVVAIMLVVTGVAIAKSLTTNIRLGKTSFGMSYVAPRLQDGHRRPIYMFTKDPRNQSRCTGNCLGTFSPVIARGAVKAINGARQKLLGVINRGHGVKQVTYNHHPLYIDIYDTPGVAAEDGCQYFGGSWYVVGRNGNPDRRFNMACGY